MTATATDLFQLPPVPPSITTVGVIPPDDDDGEPTPAPVPAPPAGPPPWLAEFQAAHAAAVRRLSVAGQAIPPDADAVDLYAAWRLIYPHDPAGMWTSQVDKTLRSAAGSIRGDIAAVEGRVLEQVFPALTARLASSTVAAGLIHGDTLAWAGVLGEISFVGRTGRFFYAEYRNLPDAVRTVAPPESVRPEVGQRILRATRPRADPAGRTADVVSGRCRDRMDDRPRRREPATEGRARDDWKPIDGPRGNGRSSSPRSRDRSGPTCKRCRSDWPNRTRNSPALKAEKVS